MKSVTTEILIHCGASPKYAGLYTDSLNLLLPKYGITTFNRLAHFLSQNLHESQAFTKTVENLNYSAVALRKTWPKRFPTLTLANQYARQPQKIANYVYANRLGNGAPASNEGWIYRGRGTMQCTGKGKYLDLSREFGIDYIKSPELLERPSDAIKSSFWYWKVNGLNKVADTDNVKAVTYGINGGYNGLEDREKLLVKCKAAIITLF